MSSWRQLRHDKVQRHRLAPSNPVSSAIKRLAQKTAALPTPSAAMPTSSATTTTIQPISASHNRCQTSQTGAKSAAQT
jgi:hypothetical protein